MKKIEVKILNPESINQAEKLMVCAARLTQRRHQILLLKAGKSVERGHLVELASPESYDEKFVQRDANRFLGFTAQQTLDYTQSLYEKKLVTYPRTDSRFLTEDMENMIPDLAGKMAAKFGYTRKMVVHPKQVIKNSKVSDHHAIIPTVNVADAEFGELPSVEQKVLSLITGRLLLALGDPAVRNEVDVEFTCADTVFRAKAKNIREKGWRDIQEWIMGGSAESTDSENDRKEKSENADMLACIATLTNGKSYPLQNPKMEEGKTTPKKHFTEDSLLSAMESLNIINVKKYAQSLLN